jgi:pimeloyl-ACP methyl ester carboxylesterase
MTRPTALAPLVLALGACASAPAREPAPELHEPPAERFATFDGGRVRYEDHGRGSVALVFVHGWASDARVWSGQRRAFGDVGRNLYVDLPGHGGSDAPEGVEYSMERLANGIAAAMDDAGVERAILVGHSNGVPTILRFRQLHPERTRALVGLDGSLRPMFDAATADAMFAPLRTPDYRGWVEGMMTSMLSAELLAELLPMALATPQHVMLGTGVAATDPVIYADERLDVPLLVLNTVSPFWTEEYVASVRALAPGVDYRALEGLGHFLQLEDPERINAALDEFVGGL